MEYTEKNIRIKCNDEVELGAILLVPEMPEGVIQFNCGTGAKKEFYLSFLKFLAKNGFICCLWDYRGSGDSAPTSLKNCNYRFSDYGMKDMPSVKYYLQQKYPNLPFFILAHSAGGQQIGLMHDLTGIQGMICFAVSVGYPWYMPLGYRLLTLFFFYLFTPVSIFLKGYVDAKRFNIMEDLPKNVALEWRDWCSKPNYLFDKNFMGKSIPKGNFENYTFPIQVFWTSDDPISNKKSIPTFWKHLNSNQGIQIKEVAPKNYQQKYIGHFGFFKKKMKDNLWKETLQQLNLWLKK
ncbi:MAG: alpha/beta fold hydrolase [Bacteroidota bacterium]